MGWIIAKIVGAVIGVALIIWLLVIGLWGLGVITADPFGRGEAHKQIHSADFMIQAYNEFFDKYASIQAAENNIHNLEDQLAMQEPYSREWNYTLTSLTGAKSLMCDTIAQYNTDAQKNWTEGQFRDADLPYQIESQYCK